MRKRYLILYADMQTPGSAVTVLSVSQFCFNKTVEDSEGSDRKALISMCGFTFRKRVGGTAMNNGETLRG